TRRRQQEQALSCVSPGCSPAEAHSSDGWLLRRTRKFDLQTCMTRWVLLVVALLAAPQVKALECPVMAGASPGLSAVDAQARIEFIRQRLSTDSRYMNAWKWSWVGVYGAMTLAQG